MAYRQLLAKLGSIKELAKDRVSDLKARVKSKEGDIKKREKAIGKNKTNTKKSLSELSLWNERCTRFKAAADAGHAEAEKKFKRSIKEYYAVLDVARSLKCQRLSLKRALHQNKRRLGVLRHKLSMAERVVDNPSICFGSKKLFNAQFNLAANGYADHDEWLIDWRDKRKSHFKFDGDALAPCGNAFARITESNDGLFNLELRLPEKLKHFAQETIRNGQVSLAKYARMLSSLAYNSFDTALASACARNRVAHRRVNPAYTSLIGRVKFARRYGLSVHAAAAVSIARRAMELSEGLPRNVDGSVSVPLNNSDHVTLAPPVRTEKGKVVKTKSAKHVWSEWSEVNKELQKVHEAQRLSGRVKRSRPYTRHWRECGGTGHLRHGLSGLIGRAEKIQLSRNGQGLAKRQEAIPEMKIRHGR